jgi:hypothetical protein
VLKHILNNTDFALKGLRKETGNLGNAIFDKIILKKVLDIEGMYGVFYLYDSV